MLKITSALDKRSIEIEDVDWIGFSSNIDGDFFIITREGITTVESNAINNKTFEYISCGEDRCYETTDVAWNLFEKLCDTINDR